MKNTVLNKTLTYVLDRLDAIDEKYKTTSSKSSQWRKMANKVHKDLLAKDKSGKRIYTDSTYHTALTTIRNAIKDTGRKHPALTSTAKKKGYLNTAIAELPAYTEELRAIAAMPAGTIASGKDSLSKQLQNDLKGNEGALIHAIDVVDGLLVDHPLVTMLSKPRAMRQKRIESEKSSLEDKSTNMKRYNFPAVLGLAERELESDSYTALAWAIALLTGRRSVEVMYHAEFTKIDSQTVMFSGQAKKRLGTESESYPIPVLADADKVIKALKRLRAMEEVSRFRGETVSLNGEEVPTKGLKTRDLNKAINQSTNGSLNDRAKRLLKDKAEVFKNTRGIYARYCADTVRTSSQHWKGQNDQPINEDQFLKRILGHVKVDEVKHYRQVELSFEDTGDWLKVKEKQEKNTGGDKPEKAKKATQNWRATKGIKEMGEAIEAYTERFVELPARKVNINKVHEFHFDQLRWWAAENPNLKITQTAVTKNKGNTKESGTGTRDLKANRYTFQAWVHLVGADSVEAYNEGKSDN